MSPRLPRIHSYLKQKGLDGLIISAESNISYLCEYACRDAYLLICQKENIYFTDSRYIEEVKKNLSGCRIIKANGSVFKLIAQACTELRLKRIAFEERSLPFAEYAKISENLKKGAKLIPTHNLIEALRQVKGIEELKKIKKAIWITKEAFGFIKSFIAAGRREIEVAAELERFIRYKGASSSAFDIIVASGPNSRFPHHLTSLRKIKNNETLLIDLGVDFKGYKSDLTRIFFLGKINSLNQDIYDTVKEAQARAIKKIKPAVKINEIDIAARQYIAHKGYGKFFVHNTGHGIGLQIHEDPHISSNEGSELKPGMVFTVEPGIYLPGRFGVRIEDMVLVSENGCEVLSGAIDK
ncbi:aminopeptidase P family protein [bacterium]|nr:MAG: aminopeptidase P family protein [bacterium]